MSNGSWRWLCMPLAALLLLAAENRAQAQAANRAGDEQAIRQASQEYLAALKRRDAKALADLWTADGDFIDEAGRLYAAKEIVDSLAQAVGESKREVKLLDTKIRFLSADVAIEDGVSEVINTASKDASVVRGRFSATWVKRDGKWRLASLREARVDSATGPAELAKLDWMIGNWSATSNDATVELSTRWNESGTYLLRELRLMRDGKTMLGGTQRIGWDPATRKIKSWIFDSDGGYGEGLWIADGASWVVQASGVLPDGRRTSSTNIFTPNGADRFTWKSIAARTAGESLPDIEMQFVKKPATNK